MIMEVPHALLLVSSKPLTPVFPVTCCLLTAGSMPLLPPYACLPVQLFFTLWFFAWPWTKYCLWNPVNSRLSNKLCLYVSTPTLILTLGCLFPKSCPFIDSLHQSQGWILCFHTSCHCYVIVTNSFVEVFLVKLLWKFPINEIHYFSGNIENVIKIMILTEPLLRSSFYFFIYNMQIMIQNSILWKLKRWIACIFCKSREWLTF